MAERRRSVTAAVAAVVVVGLVAGCGESRARRDARRGLTEQLVDAGVEPELAGCIVEHFFEGRDDEELAGFFERPELTDAEAAEVAELTRRCLGEG